MSDELPKNLTEFMNWKKASEEFELDPQLSTVGDLRKLIKIMQSEKRSEKGIEGLKDVGMGVLADLVPGGGTALSLAQTLKGMYTAPDDKKTNTMLDKLNVDDEVAMIVDDTVEENFLNQALKAIEGLSDDSPMPNINKELSDWLKSKYDARTVDGWETNESLVRDYVRNVLLEKSYGSAKSDSRMIKVNDMRIRIDIDNIDYRATQHSQERQSRHKDSQGRGFGISSKSIDKAIDAAIGDIINDYANGQLRNGERFLIVARTGPGVPLNIVGALNMRKGPDDFGVITVMRKENFMSELPTYEVKV